MRIDRHEFDQGFQFNSDTGQPIAQFHQILIKRLGFLDILKEEGDTQAENEDERFDIDFTLMTGELAHLLDDLIEALGGELIKDA